MKNKKRMFILAIIVVVIGLVIAGYFLYTYSKQCSDQECFDKALVKCDKVFYVKDGIDTIMQYNILGRSWQECMIDVKLIQVKKGTAELSPLEGKSMVCSIPFGAMAAPEANLRQCHGLLKEEIQELMISRLHAQIIENLGKIGEETIKII